MIYAQASTSFDAVFEGVTSGLVGTVGVRIIDLTTDTEVVGRTTSGIDEVPAGSGIYSATLTAPVTPGNRYLVVWDTGGTLDPTNTFSEELQVFAGVPPGIPTSPGPGETFLDLQEAALGDDFDPTKYRARAKLYLNQALGRIGRRVYSLQRRATATITLEAGTSGYSLPDDFLRVVSFRDPAKHPGELDEVDPGWIDDSAPSTGAPAVFAVDADQLLLWPAPSSGGTLTLRYWAAPATLSNDADLPAIPNDYTDLLVTYARAKLFLAEDDKPMHDALMGDFNISISDMRSDLQHTSLRRVRQIPRMWGGSSRPRFARP